MARVSAAQRQRERATQLRILLVYERSLAERTAKILRSAGRAIAKSYAETHEIPAVLPQGSTDALRRAIGAHLLNAGAALAKRAVGRWKARNRFEEVLAAWVDAHAAETVLGIDATVMAAIREIIASGVANADTGSDIAQAIRNRFDGEIGRAHALKIARTEVHMASSVAQQAAAEDSAVDLVKTWCAAQDDRTRESHRDADGQQRELNEPFDVGGSSMLHPGEGPPEETINCRCVVMYTPRE